MRNKTIFLLYILTMLFMHSCYYQRNSNKTADCDNLLKSSNLLIDTTVDVDKYIKDITHKILTLKKIDLKKSYYDCSKPEILKHYLKIHPQIDSVIITPSAHGISYFRKDQNVWSNIIIE